jgi:molybdopterin-biosynthesis enzyme MoeA-like protein
MLWIHVAANEAPDEDRLLYAQKFFEAGFTFSETVTAAPDEETLVHIIETARESHDVLIVSGGLAPGGASRAAVRARTFDSA